MKILYKANAVSQGGRSGRVRVENTPLEFDLAVPVEMNGTGKNGVNPEQLFAAGYAACFESAILHVARRHKIALESTSVTAEVGIGPNEQGGYQLQVSLVAFLPGIDQEKADLLVQEAHMVCPYSNATRGNIQVTVSARIE